ncbi:hypothetical protein ACGFNY_44765 [Streptomyces chartreusis]|uniref:hypothetical protein n=1 Tax=Streptomyces chartreusis TaxID=1969 RepID=UPI00371B4CB9
MTLQKQEAIEAPYAKCMSDHGVTSVRDRKFGTTDAHDETQSTLDTAHRACASKVPLPPWENDPKNPAALDFNRAVVACLHGKGARKVAVAQVEGEINVSFGGADTTSSPSAWYAIPARLPA